MILKYNDDAFDQVFEKIDDLRRISNYLKVLHIVNISKPSVRIHDISQYCNKRPKKSFVVSGGNIAKIFVALMSYIMEVLRRTLS